MLQLPIKIRDGDKEACAAGRKQTDKTNVASLPSLLAITYGLFTADKEI